MSESTGALRLGAVPFVNARPLIHFIDSVANPPVELTLEVPSKLTHTMRDGLVDAALLPSIEYFRASDYKIIPHISISADGAVDSVKIFSRTAIGKLRSLALDESSRTSTALASILLKRKLGFLPEMTDCSPEANLSDIEADALLLIGDSTMALDSSDASEVLDLGEEWKRLTGLPFVYAMWVVHEGIDAGPLGSKLLEARDMGLSHLPEIAAEAEAETGLAADVCLEYLKNTMRYGLGDREIEALMLFQEFASEDGLCEGGVDIAFAD
jgi:chorismate dehydratase